MTPRQLPCSRGRHTCRVQGSWRSLRLDVRKGGVQCGSCRLWLGLAPGHLRRLMGRLWLKLWLVPALDCLSACLGNLALQTFVRPQSWIYLHSPLTVPRALPSVPEVSVLATFQSSLAASMPSSAEHDVQQRR